MRAISILLGRRVITRAASAACLLISACATSVPAGQPPETPEELVSLVKHLADSGRLTDPNSVASMLGATLTLNKRLTISSDGCERDLVSYDVPRDYLPWDHLEKHPIVSLGRTLDPEPFRPRITQYFLTFYKQCANNPAHAEAHIMFENLNYWTDAGLHDLERLVGNSDIGLVADGAFELAYYPSGQSDVIATFEVTHSGRVTLPLYRIYIEQSMRIEKLRKERAR